MKYRTVGLASNVMQAMGASVAQIAGTGNSAGDGKGRHRGVRVQQPDLGQPLRRPGRRQVLLHGLLPPGVGSHRSRVQQDEVESLAKEQQQILRLAGQAANSDDMWKAWDMYSKDLDTLVTKHGVHVKRTLEGDLQGAARGLG